MAIQCIQEGIEEITRIQEVPLLFGARDGGGQSSQPTRLTNRLTRCVGKYITPGGREHVTPHLS
jgi:hypothetical protein